MEQEQATVYKLVQFDDKELVNAPAHAHGNFRPGIKKESEIMHVHKIENPSMIEQEIENFLSSGSRIVVVEPPTNTSTQETRKLFSSTLLKLSSQSMSYRRVIVREYDNVLYLARRAFWNGKRLPIEFEEELSSETEIGIKVRQQNEKVREIRHSLEHMSLLTIEQEVEIKEWEEHETAFELAEVASKMMKHAFA